MKDLRVAVIVAGKGVDQSSDYNDIIKICATRGDCYLVPLTDYFQAQNDEEIPNGVFTFLLDIEKDIDLTGTNIDGIHKNIVSTKFLNSTEIGDANLELSAGMEVIEEDGHVGVVSC